MKKILLKLMFLLFVMNLQAQEMKFNNIELDYGLIDKGANGEREFKFKNEGSAPLVITDAKGSCGCTVPTFPKEPIMPGESGVIKVKYDTQRVGAFTKYITLTSNDKANPTLRLKIYGIISSEPGSAAPDVKSK